MITFSTGVKFEYKGSGLFKSDGEWIHPERIIDTYELILMVGGNAYIYENDEKYRLSKNDILLLEPNKLHGGFERSENVSFFWMHFDISDEINNIPKFMNCQFAMSLKTMFSQLLHISNTPGYISDSCDMACALILNELIFNSKSELSSVGSLAAEIKEWIRININSDITVKTIAKTFGYHENHISRVFKSAYGESIKDYIISLKIKSAESFLQTTLYTVKQISFLLGFKGENNFIKFFEYHKKMTPTEYRNTFVNTHLNNK